MYQGLGFIGDIIHFFQLCQDQLGNRFNINILLGVARRLFKAISDIAESEQVLYSDIVTGGTSADVTTPEGHGRIKTGAEANGSLG
jgi:hypothetical protein